MWAPVSILVPGNTIVVDALATEARDYDVLSQPHTKLLKSNVYWDNTISVAYNQLETLPLKQLCDLSPTI